MSTGASSLVSSMQDEAGSARSDFSYMPDPEQLDLLRDDHGNLPKDALRRVRAAKGRGRPKGAKNRKSQQLAKYFIEKYGDPLDALGEIINTPIDLIYEQMVLAQGGEFKNKRVTGRDALEFRQRAIMDVMPYIHGKQPIAIDVNGKADAVIFIPGLNAPDGFTKNQLQQAVEALGVGAIEQYGIRMLDGTLLEPPSKAEAAAPDDEGGEA
jgi:hypothetical protein